MTILYLHGFLSSPESNKVRVLRKAAPKAFECSRPI